MVRVNVRLNGKLVCGALVKMTDHFAAMELVKQLYSHLMVAGLLELDCESV